MNLDPVRTGTGLLFSCSQQNYKPIKIQTVVKGMHFEVIVYVVSHFKKLLYTENIFNLDMQAELTLKLGTTIQ